MKALKTLWIVVAVLAVLQIVGGIAYTVWTAQDDAKYTYVTCTVIDVQSSADGDVVTVEGITVNYVNGKGENVIAQMIDFPSSFSARANFVGRYATDPYKVSAMHTDWFTPLFLLCLGVAYAVVDIVALCLRKHFGLYAMQQPTDDVEPVEEDYWTLAEDTGSKDE